MSDPVTNAQIEDVLSSIRRLVSEDTRQNLRPARPERPAARPAPAEDKLVLTPALRVADPVEPTSGEPSEQDEQAAAEAAFRPVAEDDQPLELSGAFQVEELSWEDDGDAVEIEAELEVDLEPEADLAEDVALEVEVEEVDEAPWRDPDARLFDAAGVSPLASPQDDGPLDVAAEPEPSEDSDLSRKVAALEKMIAKKDETWEPDGVEEDAYSGTRIEAMTWEDVAPDGEEAEDAFRETPSTTGYSEPSHATMSDPEIDFGDEDDEDEPDLFADTGTMIDEAALRELVADIVREELQGALGERITRNVRKLVRREIHRALSIQDLD
jgi:hypothetical protein